MGARLNDLTQRIIGLAIEVHRELGPGLLESAYEECLAYELKQASIKYERQKLVPVKYKTLRLDCDYRLDLFVADQLIIEVKSVSELARIFEAQLLTYLKLTRVPIGLLINFNVPVLKSGIRRLLI